MNYIVKAYEYEEVMAKDQESNINGSQMEHSKQHYGCKLVGIIPVWDTVGIHEIFTKYNAGKDTLNKALETKVEKKLKEINQQ